MTVLIKENFITEEQNAALLEQFQANRAMGEQYTARIQLTARDIDDIRAAFVKELQDFYNDPNISPEAHTLFVEMQQGDSQPLHADAQKEDGSPNHTPWRTYVALLYLTTDGEDHDGGELRLPQLDLTIPCKARTLIGFPATNEYMHEVLPVTRGARINMATWMQPNG